MDRNPWGHCILLLGALAALGVAGCASTGGSREDRRRPLQHYQLARVYFEAGKVPQALEEIRRSIELDAALPQTHFYLGYIHWSERNWTAAEPPLRRAIELNPYYTDARMYLAQCLDSLGRGDEALEQLGLALRDRTYPQPEKIHFNRAMIHDRQGNVAAALDELRLSVEIRPRYYRAHAEMARLYEDSGDQERAIGAYRAAEPGFANDPRFLYRYGAALLRAGDEARAAELLRRVLDLAPGSGVASEAEELLGVIG